MAGNFLADALRGKAAFDALPHEVFQGVLLHREIDAFTDAHPLVRQGIQRLRPRHGKYAGVVLDILYDHLLARHWDAFSAVGIHDHSQATYAIYPDFAHLMPQPVWARLERMIAHDWLARYGSIENLRFVFERMAERARFENLFKDAHEDVLNHDRPFTEEFLEFYPALFAHAKKTTEGFA